MMTTSRRRLIMICVFVDSVTTARSLRRMAALRHGPSRRYDVLLAEWRRNETTCDIGKQNVAMFLYRSQ